MHDPNEFERIYDDWEQTLSDAQRETCQRALRNAQKLENIGTQSAKELLVALLLFCEGKFIPPPGWNSPRTIGRRK